MVEKEKQMSYTISLEITLGLKQEKDGDDIVFCNNTRTIEEFGMYLQCFELTNE